MSSLAVKHSCDSATRSLKLVQTSIDSLTADLQTLADAGYHNTEPLHNRCFWQCTVLLLYTMLLSDAAAGHKRSDHRQYFLARWSTFSQGAAPHIQSGLKEYLVHTSLPSTWPICANCERRQDLTVKGNWRLSDALCLTQVIFTALHCMQRGLSDERLSVRPSVRLSVLVWWLSDQQQWNCSYYRYKHKN